jgi:cobalamin synthase
LGIAIITALLISQYFTRKYDGLSGDMYGFMIEVSEIVLLQAALLL